MNTSDTDPNQQPVPDGMEQLPAEFLREHGAQEGMKWRNRHCPDHEFVDFANPADLNFVLDTTDFLFIAPKGTMARVLAAKEREIKKDYEKLCEDHPDAVTFGENPPAPSHPSAGDGEAATTQPEEPGEYYCTIGNVTHKLRVEWFNEHKAALIAFGRAESGFDLISNYPENCLWQRIPAPPTPENGAGTGTGTPETDKVLNSCVKYDEAALAKMLDHARSLETRLAASNADADKWCKLANERYTKLTASETALQLAEAKVERLETAGKDAIRSVRENLEYKLRAAEAGAAQVTELGAKVTEFEKEADEPLIYIRCQKHLWVLQQNKEAHNECECGACIAAERDEARAQLADAKTTTDSMAKVLESVFRPEDRLPENVAHIKTLARGMVLGEYSNGDLIDAAAALAAHANGGGL